MTRRSPPSPSASSTLWAKGAQTRNRSTFNPPPSGATWHHACMATKLKDKKSAKAVEKSFAKAARKARKKSGVKGTKVGKGPVESAAEPFAQAFAVAQELRFKPGRPLSEIDPGSTPGFTGSSD